MFFYRELPIGNTINLSEMANTSGGPFGELILRAFSDDHAGVVWSETPESSYWTDIYFWNSSTNQVKNLSDSNLASGNVSYFKELLFDSQGHAHVIWAETVSGYEQDLLYWNESTDNVQVLSSPTPSGSGGNVTNLHAIINNDNVYVSWSEHNGDNSSFDVFYWDSVSEIRRNLSISPYEMSSIWTFDFWMDSIGESHVLWMEDVDSVNNPICPYYWNSTDMTTISLIADLGNCAATDLKTTQDDAGNIHVSWVNEYNFSQNGLYYWQVDTAQPITVTNNIGRNDWQDGFIVSGSDSTAHLVWESDDYGDGDDIIYWNSDNQQILNLSDHAESGEGKIYNKSWVISEDDVFHFIWTEPEELNTSYTDLFYWNSQGQITQNLSDDSKVTGRADNAKISANSLNVVYVVWGEQNVSDDELDLFYWRSDAGQVTAVPGLGNGPTNARLGGVIHIGQDEKLHVVYGNESNLSDEGYNMYYWHEGESVVEITDIENTEDSAENQNIVENGLTQRITILWIEDYDLYAAFEPSELEEKVYIPLIINQ